MSKRILLVVLGLFVSLYWYGYASASTRPPSTNTATYTTTFVPTPTVGGVHVFVPERVGPDGQVVGVDINADMLAIGRSRLVDAGIAQGVELLIANAEQLQRI